MAGTVPQRAMVLAAGRGERLRPLTDRVPKPLLAAGSRPLVGHVLARLAEAGFREVVVNAGWQAARLMAALGDGGAFGVRIRWSREPPGAYETAGGIVAALPLLGEGPFVVANADVWSGYPFARLRRPLRGLAHLVLVDNPPHHPGGDFGLLGDGRVHPTQGRRLTYTGIAVLHPALLAGCGCGRQPLAPLLRHAAAHGLVTGERWEGAWLDVGTPARLAELRARLGAAA